MGKCFTKHLHEDNTFKQLTIETRTANVLIPSIDASGIVSLTEGLNEITSGTSPLNTSEDEDYN